MTETVEKATYIDSANDQYYFIDLETIEEFLCELYGPTVRNVSLNCDWSLRISSPFL